MVEAEACMILDDDELEAAAKRVNWRTGNSFELRSLFRSPAKSETTPPTQWRRPFPNVGGQGKFPFQRTWKIAARSSAAATAATPAQKSLMEVDWNPTPEEIAVFGVPLLPLPPLCLQKDTDTDT